MNGMDYQSMNAFQKALYKVKSFFVGIPKVLFAFFFAIGNSFYNFGKRFADGDFATKLSYIIMGFGNAVRGQIIKGILFLVAEVAYVAYMITFGWQYISEMLSLGTVHRKIIETVLDTEKGTRIDVTLADASNSMLIMLFGLLTLFITIAFFAIYVVSTKSAAQVEKTVKSGKKPISFIQECKELLDSRFHCTMLTFPSILVGVFTVVPLIFMILIAFTSFDSFHQHPASSFQWVGLENFHSIFGGNAKKAATFISLTKWTFIWAIFATFTNYIAGMIVALMINKKGIRFKPFFRTLFVLSVAVPQFVTLLLMRQMLNKSGIINQAFMNFGWIQHEIPFLTETLTARITVILVNMWVGIPYTILITSGILMNIPEELYESAKIDGASPVVTFFKITLPYMLFVTTPYLITQFIGNINNFNVIYLLTAGEPTTTDLYNAGNTDLLVTWLFKLSLDKNNYNLAAAVGILVFVVCAGVSLLTYNFSNSAKNEEEFS